AAAQDGPGVRAAACGQCAFRRVAGDAVDRASSGGGGTRQAATAAAGGAGAAVLRRAQRAGDRRGGGDLQGNGEVHREPGLGSLAARDAAAGAGETVTAGVRYVGATGGRSAARRRSAMTARVRHVGNTLADRLGWAGCADDTATARQPAEAGRGDRSAPSADGTR